MNTVDFYQSKYCASCPAKCKGSQLELTSCLLSKIAQANERIMILEDRG